MKICVMITTYNRANGIYKLTKALKKQTNCTIVVVDDGSKEKVNTKYIDIYEKSPYNYGKRKWYKTVNILWSKALATKADLYIMMVDDSLPVEGFFDKVIKLWNSIDDDNKIALHLANNNRKRNWTDFDRVSFNKDLFLTQTTETTFVSTPEFISYTIPKVSPKRWLKNRHLGSGVFPLINRHWVGKGRNIYGVKKSLVKANPECKESKMNPEERKKNPWILK